MSDRQTFKLSRLFTEEDGQIVPWTVFLLVLFCGAAGLTIDLGHAYYCYRDLQASTDAAALAGAYALSSPTATTTSVSNMVTAYSSAPGGANISNNLPGDTITTSFLCVTDAPSYVVAPCSASPTNYNVVKVVQHATVPTYFVKVLSVLGLSSAQSLTLTVTSTATMMNGKNQQINLAIVLDSTGSMGQSDNSCGSSMIKMKCALKGVRTLLSELAPCTASSVNSTCVPYDQVSVFTYPNVEADTAQYDYDTSSTNPTILPYYVPAQPSSSTTTWTAPTGALPTYQITDYQSDYSSNNQRGGSPNTNSNLYNATSVSSKTSGIQPIGGQGTYFAGAINAAQTSLMAAQLANPSSINYMIILSDGAANSTTAQISGSGSKNFGAYGSAGNECQQAIAAAQNATALGTTVYTIAYAASNNASDCSTDYTTTTVKGKTTKTYTISPCQTLMQMSSGYVSGTNAPNFYQDSSSSCGTSSYNIDTIFGIIASQFTRARLIPNGIT